LRERPSEVENTEIISSPRILISALRGSNAKTIISLGLITAFKRRNIKILPYKKGPDYIDAAWLSKAAREVCDHLDLYLMDEDGVREVFSHRAGRENLSIVEGNRGLFDGVDIYGTYSTAKIARLLEIPVILIIDCTKITNTVASLVLGCQTFDKDVPICGVILNRIAGERHGDIIKRSVEHHTGLPVLGLVPNLDIDMPERHLGLTTVEETVDFTKKLDFLGDLAERYLDLDKILDLAKNAPKIEQEKTISRSKSVEKQKVTIGIIKDAAFQFYYSANLEALTNEGAELTLFDSMQDIELKPVDLLYIPGGFPEVHADKISENKGFRESVKHFAQKGMPIYGECGAVIYLGNRVSFRNQRYDMCGVFPLEFELTHKPAGHGYTKLVVDRENPFFPKDVELKGHEFHYSTPINWNSSDYNSAFHMKKGVGFGGKRDGIFFKNVFATYTHIHAAGTRQWASWMINVARKINFSKQYNT